VRVGRMRGLTRRFPNLEGGLEYESGCISYHWENVSFISTYWIGAILNEQLTLR